MSPYSINNPYRRPKIIGASPQAKTGARQSKANQDRSPENIKVPSGNLDKAQRIAQAGETVPIVFCKRVSGKGGVWVAPPLLKTGSSDFVPSLLFCISQGKIVSTPDPINLWSGLTNQQLRLDSSMTLTHVYKTSAELIATPVCPIAGDGLYCGIESFSYLEPVLDATGVGNKTRIRQTVRSEYYFGLRAITRGTGNTDNTVFSATRKVFDNSTGNNVTAAYNAAAGTSSGPFVFNTDTSGNPVQVGGIVDLIAFGGYIAPTNAFSAIGDGSGSFTFEYTVSSQNSQYNISNPINIPYALTGVQNEIVASIYPNPYT